ncbi:MAG: glycosyltransferase family 4 protein [Acidobacteriaceae bacterium]
MRVVFVLPCSGKDPIGGLKVVYEYANHLSRRGHEVTLIHAAFQRVDTPISEIPRRTLFYWKVWASGKHNPDSWFKIDPKVKMLWVRNLHWRNIPSADAVVATSWDTAEWVNRYPATKGTKFYLIQHFETWSGSEDRVSATWKMPLNKIVIARWLEQIATSMNETCCYIPNGLDFAQFGVDVDPAKRSPEHVLMMYHLLDWKGSQDGLDALKRARQSIPGLRASTFGVPVAPKGLPDWIDYHRCPPQAKLRELYNQAAVFVAPSWNEGWGLPASEAMMCGAAVAATDIGGHREFAIHEQTALLSPPKNPDALAANIVRLMSDDPLRIKIARQGHENIQRFTWDKAVEQLEAALTHPR